MKFTPPIPSCSNENFCFHVGDYSFGFNGKELDKEGMGGGASTYDYGFRIYNSALAKFLSVDPLGGKYPMLTPYQFASNTPIWAIDQDGLEAWKASNSAEEVMSVLDFQRFVFKTAIELVEKGDVVDNQFDCANFVITVLALYYKENGVRFQYTIGGVKIDSNDERLDFDSFMQKLWGLAGASNLRDEGLTDQIEQNNMEAGDMINSGGHVQIYLETNSDPQDPEPVKCVQSSGHYIDENSPMSETNPPEFESYSKVWSDVFRWDLLSEIPQTPKQFEPIPLKPAILFEQPKPDLVIKN